MNLIWADRLRNLATVMVIAIHLAAPIAENHPDLNTWFWWLGNWWNAVSRAGVPVFVMLSGFLLLGKDYPTGEFLHKRVSRVIVPALVWMGVYLLYGYLANGKPATFGEALLSVVEGPVHYHLWFIYLIIGLYLVYPIMRPWVRQARDRDFWYLLTLCAVASWGYKIMQTFFHVELGLYWEFFCNNLGYFVLGYYLGHKPPADAAPQQGLDPWPLTARQLFWAGAGLALLGTVVTATGAFWAKSSLPADTHRYFYDYLTPNVGFAAMGWFLLARFGFGGKPLLDIEKEFAAASFGIYLSHVLVMDWWAECGYWHSKIHPLKGLPALVGLVSGMTFLVISFLRAMPGGKKIT